MESVMYAWPVLWHLKGGEQLGNTQDLQWEHGRICQPRHNWQGGFDSTEFKSHVRKPFTLFES